MPAPSSGEYLIWTNTKHICFSPLKTAIHYTSSLSFLYYYISNLKTGNINVNPICWRVYNLIENMSGSPRCNLLHIEHFSFGTNDGSSVVKLKEHRTNCWVSETRYPRRVFGILERTLAQLMTNINKSPWSVMSMNILMLAHPQNTDIF